MSPDTQSLLYLIAEVSIATVALSGITMVLAVSGSQLKEERANQIATQLRMASIVVACSLLPLLLNEFKLSEALVWRGATGAYILLIIYVMVRGIMRAESYTGLPPKSARLVMVAAIGAVSLLPMNLWLAQGWPYITQLFFGWAVSMALFLEFIHIVLSERREREDG